jgi:hypothetical protein
LRPVDFLETQHVAAHWLTSLARKVPLYSRPTEGVRRIPRLSPPSFAIGATGARSAADQHSARMGQKAPIVRSMRSRSRCDTMRATKGTKSLPRRQPLATKPTCGKNIHTLSDCGAVARRERAGRGDGQPAGGRSGRCCRRSCRGQEGVIAIATERATRIQARLDPRRSA